MLLRRKLGTVRLPLDLVRTTGDLGMRSVVGTWRQKANENTEGRRTAVAEPSDFTVNDGYSQSVEICPYSPALNLEAAWPLASLVHPLTALACPCRTGHHRRNITLLAPS